MKTITGKFGKCLVFSDTIDQNALDQMQEILNHECVKDTNVALMPDAHFGAGVPVGTTIRLDVNNWAFWKVAPTIISGDIGCGMLATKINQHNIDFAKLDHVINTEIPSGFSSNDFVISAIKSTSLADKLSFESGRASLDARIQLGTLGGGNHFIELDIDSNGDYWLVTHCGSRHFGVDILNHHLEIAKNKPDLKRQASLDKMISEYKKNGKQKKLESAIKRFKANNPEDKSTYATLSGADLFNYLNDVQVGQEFAKANRFTIQKKIIDAMGWSIVERFESVHNYFDYSDYTIRKGATAAHLNQRVLIPINMRDGSLLCKGKNNKEWNFSAPHGAGRHMSRTESREKLNMKMFRKDMKDIYTTSVTESTLDEAPEAYKDIHEITDNITPTCKIVDIIKPVYNYKAH